MVFKGSIVTIDNGAIDNSITASMRKGQRPEVGIPYAEEC